MKKAQSWSLDIIIGSIIFVGAFFTFYYLLNSGTAVTVDDLKDEATIVIKEIASPEAPVRIIDNNEVNITKIADLKNYTYSQLKSKLRIENDFCIYFENEKGELLLINNSFRGIGSPNINISNVPCSF